MANGAELKNTVSKRLATLARNVPNEVGRALNAEAHVERAESMRRTPVEFGPLRASHDVPEPKVDGRDISQQILVGGPSAPYALYVHENLEAFHKVGQAKFLESTILESRPFMAQRVARRIDLQRMVGR